MNDQERELDLMVAELEQENRLMRARNERLEAENQQLKAYVDAMLLVSNPNQLRIRKTTREEKISNPNIYYKVEDK
jgi:hypothetical protein